ncbi:microtubule-associated serine/threonine-protein kinase 3-like isoform X2 [Cynoglossus semilaevis]|nr:microtubule-associated serine/threonine-protein kinase 3-like isoform X2 [Cynoglossus semilaevis]
MSSQNPSLHVSSQGGSGELSTLLSSYDSETLYKSDSEEEYFDSDLSQAINALYFIQHQLLELSKDCDFVLSNDMVSGPFFMELQDKLEKLLHETRAAWNPPFRTPDLNDFDILNTIGGGSFGTVKVVTHTETGQAFAMKTIRRQSLTRELDVQHVLLERDILTFTDNPFVVSLFCTFETDADLCIVMEYVAGGNCENLLNQGKVLPVNVARFYTAEVVLALEYLHSFGILHGDLKPENLLLTYTGHIKVADFGLSRMGPVKFTAVMNEEQLSKIIEEFTDGLIVGTPRYTAPEMILGMSYGKPVDWWALGIILYQFLVGCCPYQGTRFKDILHQVVTKKLLWPNKRRIVPDDAKVLISTLLNIDVMKRLGTRGAIELKIHPFFQEVEWYSLLDQDPIFELQEDIDFDENHFETSSESFEEDQPEEPIEEHNATDNGSTSEEDESADDECTEDSFTFELPYFCSVPFRAKAVYGSPLPLSYTLLQQISAFTQSTHVRLKEKEKEEYEQELESEPLVFFREDGAGEEEQVNEGFEENGDNDSYVTLTSNDASQVSHYSVEERKKRKHTGKNHKKRGRRRKRRRCRGWRRRRKRKRRMMKCRRTAVWTSAENAQMIGRHRGQHVHTHQFDSNREVEYRED